MLALDTGKTLQGVASSATSITYTILGDEVISGPIDAYKQLAQGQLPNAAGVLYTVPAGTTDTGQVDPLANTSGAPITGIQLFVGGAAAANAVTGAFSLGIGCFAVYAQGGWQFFNANGQIVSTGLQGVQGLQGVASGIPGEDGQDGEGWQGPQGNQGLQGIQGTQGIPSIIYGEDGQDGDPGPPGATGAAGAGTSPKGFAATMSGTQTLTTSMALLAFNTKTFDVGTLYDTTAKAWTPPAGLVQINCSLAITDAVTNLKETTVQVEILRDTTVIAIGGSAGGGGLTTVTSNFGASVCVVDQASGSNVYTIKAAYTDVGTSSTAPVVQVTGSVFSGSTF